MVKRKHDVAQNRVLLVANRLPVSWQGTGANATLVRSSGGLVSGLEPVHEEKHGLWIGNSDIPRGVDLADALNRLKAQRLICVPVDKHDARRHYEGYSNQVLWPLCHYLVDHVDFRYADYQAYARINHNFADTVVQHHKPGDLIWIHDYHLMLLPQILRQHLPEARIGFFLHIPFPASDVFRVLPRKEEILRGLLGANLIGLHTFDDARHLSNAFRRFLGVEFNADWQREDGHLTEIGFFPLGVDAAFHQRMAQAPEVQKHVAKIQKKLKNRRLILGIDRMDYTKGLTQRLDGFESMLKHRRRWQNEVVLWQLAVPSRSNLPSYKALRDTVERQVGRINGAMQTLDGPSPIQYFYRSISTEELTALYLLADVMLVTSLRDGMNLVAKEYIATRRDDTGALILSEFAGAAAELEEALIVNPYDSEALGQAMHDALTAPKSTIKERMAALRARVGANTVHHWVQQFLHALERLPVCVDTHVATPGPKAPPHDAFLATCKRSKKILVALDYDGTLVPFAAHADQAKPPVALKKLLRQLADLKGIEVAIISGRSAENLESWLGALPVHLIGEHGYQIRLLGESGFHAALQSPDLSWRQEVFEVMSQFRTRLRGVSIEHKPVSLVWHYRRAEPAVGEYVTRQLQAQLRQRLQDQPVLLLPGNKVLEVRAAGFDKGSALQHLYKQRGPFEMLLLLGDDRTDEDMFRAAQTLRLGSGGKSKVVSSRQMPIERLWSIQVGNALLQEKTHAQYRVADTDAVRRLLQALLAARTT